MPCICPFSAWPATSRPSRAVTAEKSPSTSTSPSGSSLGQGMDAVAAAQASGVFARLAKPSVDDQSILSLRPISWLLFLRVVVLSLILAGILSANILGARSWNLEGPFAKTVFSLIGALYGLSILAGILAKKLRHLRPLLYAVLTVDLLATTFGIHLSGGVQSGFTVLYMILVVAAGLTDGRKGAAYAMALASVLLLSVSILDHLALIPLIQGQPPPGKHMDTARLARHIAISLAALAAVTLLTVHMADQIQKAGQEVRKQQRALSDLALHHEQVIASLATGLVSTDENGVILTCNPKAGELLGLTAAETLEKKLSEVAPELDKPIGMHRFELKRTGAKPVSVELVVSRLFDSLGQAAGTIYLLRDRTEIERMEREVAEAERLAALGRFASGVAHEIRNPLASISGALELLRQSRPEDEDEARLTDIVLREVDRLDRLISEMLDFVRPNVNTKLELDWAEEIKEASQLTFVDPKFQDVTLDVQADEPIIVMADQPRLRQVYWNLLNNALAASPPGGTVRVSLVREGPWAVLRVEDQGPGIPREHIDRLFEPFFSTKSEGTGLGLAIARQIVQDHGGSIHVESRPGATCFTVRIPVQDPETPQIRRAATNRDPTL